MQLYQGFLALLFSITLYMSINSDIQRLRIGTETDCDFRLYKDLFFDKIVLDFTNANGTWNVFCADNLYIDTGDLRKLSRVKLSHGDIFVVKYQGDDNEVFTVEFILNFDNAQRKYERAIDISSVNKIRIGTDNSSNIYLTEILMMMIS